MVQNNLHESIIFCSFVARNYCLNAKYYLTMKTKKRQKLIVSLITDDLIHSKLIEALNDLHLEGSHYFLNLSDTIIKLMGFEGEQNEVVFEYYLDQLKRAKHVDNSENNAQFIKLANDIYNDLQLQKPIAK